jgi:hypothetical protein
LLQEIKIKLTGMFAGLYSDNGTADGTNNGLGI